MSRFFMRFRSNRLKAAYARIAAAFELMGGGKKIEVYVIGVCINKLILDRGDRTGFAQPVPAAMPKLRNDHTSRM